MMPLPAATRPTVMQAVASSPAQRRTSSAAWAALLPISALPRRMQASASRAAQARASEAPRSILSSGKPAACAAVRPRARQASSAPPIYRSPG